MKLFSRVLWIEWELMRGRFLFFLTNGKGRETQVEVFFLLRLFPESSGQRRSRKNFQPLIYIERRLFPLSSPALSFLFRVGKVLGVWRAGFLRRIARSPGHPPPSSSSPRPSGDTLQCQDAGPGRAYAYRARASSCKQKNWNGRIGFIAALLSPFLPRSST